jgi:TPR repeat protein
MEEAVSEGSLRAKHALGRLLFHDELGFGLDKARSVQLWEEAVEGGYADSKPMLALCLRRGIAVPKDDARAFRLLSEAAQEGIINAKATLAEFSDADGNSRSKAETKATRRSAKASAAVDADAPQVDPANRARRASRVENKKQDPRDPRSVEVLENFAARRIAKNSGGDADADAAVPGAAPAPQAKLTPEAKFARFREKMSQMDTMGGMMGMMTNPLALMGLTIEGMWAKEWFGGLKSADFFDDDCEFNAGNMRMMFLCKQANRGDLDAQFEVANCLATGKVVPKDWAKAVLAYAHAAEGGHIPSLVAAATCLLRGRGADKDEPQAFELFDKAAGEGNAEAKCRLAECLEGGRGTPRDAPRAFRLFEEALAGGCDEARFWVARALLFGIGTPKDTARAAALAEQAVAAGGSAEEGSVGAKALLAICLIEGYGVAKDEARAVQLLEEVVPGKLVYLDAQSYLAECRFFGRGTAQDTRTAIMTATAVLAVLAKFTDVDILRDCTARCKFLLAEAHREGLGSVAKDMDRALKLYTEAADMGSSRARQFLGLWRMVH